MNLDSERVKEMIRQFQNEEKASKKAPSKKAPATKSGGKDGGSGKIINMYDRMPAKFKDKSENPNKHLHGLELPFRAVVCAPSGSGKTNWLMNLITLFCANKGTFADITIVTRNKDEPLYRWLGDLHDGIQILEGLNSTPHLDKMDKALNHLVVWDDLVLEKNQDRICQYYIRARKLNCSVIYLSQSYFQIPKIIRSNCTYLILLKLSGDREIKLILSESGLGVSKEVLFKLYKEATNEKFSPFIIDFQADASKRYRKGFLEILPVPEEI